MRTSDEPGTDAPIDTRLYVLTAIAPDATPIGELRESREHLWRVHAWTHVSKALAVLEFYALDSKHDRWLPEVDFWLGTQGWRIESEYDYEIQST